MKKVAILIDAGFLQKSYWDKLKKNISADDIVTLSKNLICQDKEELFRIYYYDSPPFDNVLVNPIDGTKIDYSQSNLFKAVTSFHIRLAEKEYVALRKGKLSFGGWKLNKEALDRIKQGKCIITKDQVETAGLNWNNITEKLIQNNWAKSENPTGARGQVRSAPNVLTEICLTVNVEVEHERVSKILGNDFLKFLFILLQSYNVKPTDLIPDFKQKAVDMNIGLDIALLSTKRIVDKVVLVTADNDFVPAMKFARKEGLRVAVVQIDKLTSDMKQHSDEVINVDLTKLTRINKS